MTAVDWTQHSEPWRTIGPRFAKEAAAIARGEVLAFEIRNQLEVTPELVALLRKCPLQYKEIAAAIGCHASIISEIARRKSATSRYVPQLRKWLSSTTSES